MGYSTDFFGSFKLDKQLSSEHAAYLSQFSETRRMQRDVSVTSVLDNDPIRIAAGLPVGVDGGYFVGGSGYAGQDRDESIVEYNNPPDGQPGLWCQWIPSEDGTEIEWDGGEKFYNYVEWIKYLIEHFLKPWGYVLNGEVEWRGEEYDDHGNIVIENNNVKIQYPKTTWEDAE